MTDMQGLIDSGIYDPEKNPVHIGKSYFEDVVLWHKGMKQPVRRNIATLVDNAEQQSRDMGKTLVTEEYNELIDALQRNHYPDIADGAADLIWVVCGLMARYGINLDLMWEEVRRANWAKLGGPVREDGKLLKPEGWQPPNTHNACVTGIPMGDPK
jgi:NTP pyrophosphatase (non-canonical NTP hydrolase)